MEMEDYDELVQQCQNGEIDRDERKRLNPYAGKRGKMAY